MGEKMYRLSCWRFKSSTLVKTIQEELQKLSKAHKSKQLRWPSAASSWPEFNIKIMNLPGVTTASWQCISEFHWIRISLESLSCEAYTQADRSSPGAYDQDELSHLVATTFCMLLHWRELPLSVTIGRVHCFILHPWLFSELFTFQVLRLDPWEVTTFCDRFWFE